MFINCQECDKQAEWICRGCGAVLCSDHIKITKGGEVAICPECQKSLQIIV